MGTYNGFDVLHQLVEVDEGKFGFQMRVLAQMAASVAVGRGLVVTGIRMKDFNLFSARKLDCTQKTSPRLGRHVSR